jgi:hypothetical protein
VTFTPCAPGAFVAQSGSMLADQFCVACPSGSFSAVANSAQCSPWRTCNAGNYVTNFPSATMDRGCGVCAEGTYTSGPNQSVCLTVADCPAGTEQTASASSLGPPVCTACIPGQYCAGGNAPAVPCAGDTWDDDRNPATACAAMTQCYAGSHVAQPGSATSDRTCTPCPSGTFSTFGNATACTPLSDCAAGTYVTNLPSASSDRVCAACPAGSSTSLPNQSACLSAKACPAGTVQTAAGTDTSAPVCKACVPGQFCSGGMAAAVACDGDSWDNDGNPATACVPVTQCPAGTYVAQAGTSTTDRICSPCLYGTFSTGFNATACLPWSNCAAGTVQTGAATATSGPVCQPSGGGNSTASGGSSGSGGVGGSTGGGAIGGGAAGPDGGVGTGTGTATTDDLYTGLPAITSADSSVTIGPAGAHIVFPGGIVLDVPAGAFTSETTIQVLTTSQVPPEQAGFGSPLTPIIELLPNGLSFALPMRLQIAMPVGGINKLMAVSSDPGDLYSEDLALSQGSDGSLQATIWNFSYIGVYATNWGNMTVFDVPCPTDHNTKAVLGLSSQIRDVFINSFGGQLVPITGPGVFNAGDPLGMLVQPTVLNQITNTLTHAPNGAPLFAVTSAWRSLAQQFVLSVVCGTGGNSVAAPGDSNHADGSAIDLQPTAGCLKAAANGATSYEVLKLVHPAWGPLLEENGFIWYGDEAGKTVCGDTPHFDDDSAQSQDLRAESVMAFQRLWNNNNPCAAIAENGVFDPDTEMALAGSPAVGWDANPTEAPIQLPAQGAGCSGTDMCCPGNPPSCQSTCACVPTTCAAAGANCGSIPNGCGGTLNCGSCAPPQTCGGGGTPNQCGGCTPTTCAVAGANCGIISDGCGGTLECGSWCPAPQTCGGAGLPGQCGGTSCGQAGQRACEYLEIQNMQFSLEAACNGAYRVCFNSNPYLDCNQSEAVASCFYCTCGTAY